MKSLPPNDYESMPALIPPAGYILVIRDVDGDRFRIDKTQQPKPYLDGLRSEGNRRYGFELIAVIETADLAASAVELYDRHLATLSGAWLHLDNYQLHELRQSMLQTGAFRSRYISPRRQKLADSDAELPRPQRPSIPLHGGSSSIHGSRAPSAPVFVRYGTRALEERLSAQTDEEVVSRPVRICQAVGHFFDDLWTRHPGKVVAFIAFIALVCLASLDGSPYPGRSYRLAATSVPLRQDPTPTPTWSPRRRTYMVEQIAHIRACPSSRCEYLGLLPVRTEIRSLSSVAGEEIAGNETWMKFRYYDGEAYVHSSRLRPGET